MSGSRKRNKNLIRLGLLGLGMFLVPVLGVRANSNPDIQIPMDSGAVFEDSSIFGTVYVDRNQNGVQDSGEEGIGGVRLVTVTGQIITTDQNGRYSLAGVFGGRSDRGTNFIIKLDRSSLPDQYRLISSQTQTVRLSPGLPQRIDFRVTEH